MGKSVIKLFTKGGTGAKEKKSKTFWPEPLNSCSFVQFDSCCAEVSKDSNKLDGCTCHHPKEHALRGCMCQLKETGEERQAGVRPEETEREAVLEMSHITLNC